MFNVPAFRECLKRLIGNMTQSEFASARGITPEHLSRMLRAEKPSLPSKTTLRKLANGNEGVYSELLDLCGYNDKEKSFTVETEEDQAKKRLNELREGMKDMTHAARTYSSISDFLEEYIMLYDSKNVQFKVLRRREYDEGDHFFAEYVVPVIGEYRFGIYKCDIYAAVFYSETKGGRAVILDCAFDGRSLLRSGISVHEDIVEKFRELPCYYRTEVEADARDRFLKAVFGPSRDEKVATTAIGFGFSFRRDAFSGPVIKKFVENSGSSFADRPEVKRVLDGEPADAVFKNYRNKTDEGSGPGVFIAEVMRENTGIKFYYYEDVTEKPDALSAVMVPRDRYDNYEMEDMKSAAEMFAKELGIREYGECAVYTYDYLDGNLRFTIEEE